MFQKKHRTKTSVLKEIDLISLRLSGIGFIDNKLISIKERDSVFTAHFILGSNAKFITLLYSPKFLNKKLLNQLNLKYDTTYIYTTTKNIPFLLNKLVEVLEKKGNSFSKLSLKNITKNNKGLTAEIRIEKSSTRTIDKIIIKGYDNFPKTYVRHFLKLKKGTVFNSEKINLTSNSFQSISFASELKSPEVLFEKDSTTIYLYLQKNKTNKFDGLLGFNSDENGKIQFNGYLDLKLNNIFNKGESFSVLWKSNNQDRKTFNLSLATPFIFNTPFSLGVDLNIHKQDSTFLNTTANFDLAYQISSNQKFIGNFLTETSNEIGNSNTPIEAFTNSFYGATYNLQEPQVNRLYENKVYLNINGSWGARTTSVNKEQEQQSKYAFELHYIWSFNRKHSIFAKSQSALLISDSYYINELFRIGGASTIRGFSEESIFGSAYSIFNLEYRFYLNTTSKIYSISDFAFIQNKINSLETELFGFGLGYSYNSKNGIIDISYAIGKQSTIPIDLRNSTFHIKYIQLF